MSPRSLRIIGWHDLISANLEFELDSHFRILHNDGYTTEELLKYRPTVYQNIAVGIQSIVDGMRTLDIKFRNPKNEVVSWQNWFIWSQEIGLSGCGPYPSGDHSPVGPRLVRVQPRADPGHHWHLARSCRAGGSVAALQRVPVHGEHAIVSVL